MKQPTVFAVSSVFQKGTCKTRKWRDDRACESERRRQNDTAQPRTRCPCALLSSTFAMASDIGVKQSRC